MELRQLFEIRVASRYVALDSHQREVMRLVDRVLNFFEQIVYLENGRHFNKEDRKVFFEYWFDTFADAGKPALHRFIARTGYENLAREFRFHSDDYVVFYGTLMRPYSNHQDSGVVRLIKYVGPCIAPGELVDLGEWPGAVRGNGTVHGELWRVLDFEASAF